MDTIPTKKKKVIYGCCKNDIWSNIYELHATRFSTRIDPKKTFLSVGNACRSENCM